ncbi:hypothetical protein ACP70R_020035 [Stipagrostis hirtigluma subsp. patula]
MGDPGPPQTTEELARRVSALREALERSQLNTDRMVSALGAVDHRLSSIESTLRPTQVPPSPCVVPVSVRRASSRPRLRSARGEMQVPDSAVSQVRTHAIQMAVENIDRTIESADAILAQLEIARRAEDMMSRGPHEDLESYLQAVDMLKGVARFFSDKNYKSSEGVLNHVNNLLTKSALKIEEEFRSLMGTYSKPVEPDRLFDCLSKPLRTSKGNSEAVEEQASKSFETVIYRTPTLIPTRISSLLHDLAHQLVQAGNQHSCYRIYRDARGSALELTLRKLGVEKLSKDDVNRMQWEAVKPKIENWNQFMRITVKVLLAGERKNCDQVFEGISFNKNQCFAELARIHVMSLLSFGDAVAKSKRSDEKLFMLLDMYGVMHELQSEVEVIFQGRFCSEMREAAFNLTKSLAQTAKETFVDFEEAVEKNPDTICQDGDVHPLTITVINYVKSLFDYQSTLKILFQQLGTGTENESPLAVVTMKILQALQNNLDGKSKQYKDSALTHIFLMNNLHYMVRSVRRSDGKDILGNDWIQKHRRSVVQSANQYRRVALAKAIGQGEGILNTLSVQAVGSTGSSAPSDPSSSGVSRAMIKERFKSFNMQFEELHTKQSQWTISDEELRDSLRLAVAEVLLPAYRSFVTRFGNLIERGKNPRKYIRHSPEELEQLLGEFFDGRQLGEQKR